MVALVYSHIQKHTDKLIWNVDCGPVGTGTNVSDGNLCTRLQNMLGVYKIIILVILKGQIFCYDDLLQNNMIIGCPSAGTASNNLYTQEAPESKYLISLQRHHRGN